MTGAMTGAMTGGRRRRGEPLLALALVITGWIGARAVAWTGSGPRAADMAMTAWGPVADARTSASAARPHGRFSPWPDRDRASSLAQRDEATDMQPSPQRSNMAFAAPADRRSGESPALARSHGAAIMLDGAPGTFHPGSVTAELLARGASRGNVRSPGGNAAPFPLPAPNAAPTTTTNRRWSADAWLLARAGGGAALATGPAPATYGGSQAGAVLRYALAPTSRYRPSAYVRVSGALGSAGDAEAALGLSARPLPALPLIALGELRATRSAGRTRLRPAAMLVTQLPPFDLPAGIRGELYAQGGYVAGAGATPFADGQFTFDRGLTQIAGQRLRIGGGAWGGAQKGAARLDIGPSARVDLRLDRRIFARIALDYRLRVAGNAAPRSGPALTASAGF